jgi:hypothetical protein
VIEVDAHEVELGGLEASCNSKRLSWTDLEASSGWFKVLIQLPVMIVPFVAN